jgi:hypothetical protein
MPKNARIATVLALTIATLLGGAAAAQAAPPPPVARPLDCQEQFETMDIDDYDAEGWVAARVARVNNVFLGCGDEYTGVVHIISPKTAGTQHPVSKFSEQFFLDCFESLARFGEVEPDPDFPQTRLRYRKYFTEPTKNFGDVPVAATMYVDKEKRFVYTMFTTTTRATPQGNNWAGCVNYSAVA